MPHLPWFLLLFFMDGTMSMIPDIDYEWQCEESAQHMLFIPELYGYTCIEVRNFFDLPSFQAPPPKPKTGADVTLKKKP